MAEGDLSIYRRLPVGAMPLSHISLSLPWPIRPAGRVFERLKSGPKAVGVIARGLPVSRPVVSQHLKVLKEASLVADRPEGAGRVYYIDHNGLGALRAWLDQFWDQALARFQDAVELGVGKEKDKFK